jgi:phage gp29-like protein
MLDAETWMTADEALEYGFIDEISEEMDMAACAKFIPAMAKAGFKHVPQSINGKKEIPSAKEIERILRDAGCSRKVAKTILVKGYSDDLRDAGPDDEAPPVADPLRDAEVRPPASIVPSTRIADRHLFVNHPNN